MKMGCVMNKTVMIVMMLIFNSLSHQKVTIANTNNTISGLEDSPLSTVIGIVGGSILLPCNFEPILSNDSTHLVLFYRSGIGTPIYSIDARGVGVQLGSHWADVSLGGRAHISVDKRNAGLVLEELKFDDNGHYRCRVDFVESPTRNTRIRLKVIEPPTSLIVTSDYSATTRLGNIAGPFPEGAKVTLSCQVIAGDPRPQVTWWHEGSLLDDVSEVQTAEVTRNTLDLPPLTRNDLNKTLTCQASNSNLTVPLSHHITIDMIYAPTWVEIEMDGDNDGDLVMQEGVARVVTCEARGSRPPARIQWLLDGITLKQHTQDTMSDELTRSSLTLVGEPGHHGLALTCLAFTPAETLQHHTISSTTTLQVLYKPRLELRVDPHRSLHDVEEGEDVTFVCYINSHPHVTAIQWAHDGVPMQRVDSDSPERLILHSVSRTDSGGYTCAAANTEGARTSNKLILRVKFAPTCQYSEQTVYGAARHEELKVPCSVLAHPTPSSFRWAVNTSSGIVDIPLNLTSSIGTRSVVRYTPQTHHDFGHLLCWAVNEVGIQKIPCLFNVLPAAKPESVGDCHVERNNTMPGSYVVLSCIPGWDGGLNQTFTLEVRQAAKEQVLEAFRHAAQPFFIITGLQVGVEYLLTVTAANGRGSSTPITVNYTATTAAADKVVSAHAQTHALFNLLALLLVIGGVVGVGGCVSVGVVVIRRRGPHPPTHSNKNLNLCSGGNLKHNFGGKLKHNFGGKLKHNFTHNGQHTIVCVKAFPKDCEKDECMKSYTQQSGVVSNFYVTPSSLVNNRGMVTPPHETDALLQEQPICPPTAYMDSLGPSSTSTTISSTSKTSISSTSSATTVALNPDFLVRNPEYVLKNSDYQDTRLVHPDTKSVYPDTSSVNPDTRSVSKDIKSVHPDTMSVNLDTSSVNPDTRSVSKDIKSVHPDTISVYPDTMSVHPDMWSVNKDTRSALPDTRSFLTDTRSVHPDTRLLHSDTRSVHPDTRSIHPDKRLLHSDMRSVRPDTRSVRPDTRSVHPDPRLLHLDMQSVHPDTRSVHPDTRSVHQDMRLVFPDKRSVLPDTWSVQQNTRSNFPDKKLCHRNIQSIPDTQSESIYQNTHSILPDFIMQSLDRINITPESPTKNGVDIVETSSECPAVNTEYMVRNGKCYMAEGNHITKAKFLSRYPDYMGRDEVIKLMPQHMESSV